ncbi:MAG: glyoxylate/hydroxypyruvate reductase A [Rhodovibrionaceae bacterium]|nr:glyoxylate/hydroxypyruvate reductase A [Rhodovibrionaceae bacterium]
MALLFKSDTDRAEDWREAIHALDPDIEFRAYPDIGEPDDIEAALIWKPPEGLLKSFANLKAIFSLGAGVDHLLGDPELPEDVPVVRMVDPALTAGMTEWVTLMVLRHHRELPRYERQERERLWQEHMPKPPWRRRVGILGLGELGADAARALAQLRLDVMGWSRSPKDIEGIACYHGDSGLDDMLAISEILVCLLPLTPQTEGILNARLFAKLPKGAYVVNVGRGRHLVDDDLLQALDSGHLSGAALDVFRKEPLPADHPFWTHPGVFVSPHIASLTMPETAARQVVDNMHRLRRGEPLTNVVDLSRGY